MNLFTPLNQRMAVIPLLMLPWLNPFASGPLPPTLQTLFTLMCVALATLLGVWRMPRRSLCLAVAVAWVGAALLSSGMALVQFFGASEAFSPWINVTGTGEAYANLRQRNQFATLTNMGLLALLFLVAPAGELHNANGIPHAGGGGVQGTSVATFWGAACAHAAGMMLALGNVASSSRTGMVQLVAVAALVFFWRSAGQHGAQRRVWPVLGSAMFAYVAGAVLLPWAAGLGFMGSGIATRLAGDTPLCNSRLTLWANVWTLIAQRPFTGWGWGELDYAHFVTLYPGERFCEILDNAHNLPLHIAVELGVPAAVGACGLVLWCLWRGKAWRESDSGRQLAWGVLTVIALHSMLEYPLWYGPFQLAFLLAAWMLWRSRPHSQSDRGVKHHSPFETAVRAASKISPASKSMSKTPATVPVPVPAPAPAPAPAAREVLPPKAADVLLALAVLACSVYAAWDYHRISQIYLPAEERDVAYQGDTLGKIKGSWLFRNQVAFAKLTTTEVNAENAKRMHHLASVLLHFSPEARVAQKLIESATLLGRDEEAVYFLARYKVAYPVEYAQWTSRNQVFQQGISGFAQPFKVSDAASQMQWAASTPGL